MKKGRNKISKVLNVFRQGYKTRENQMVLINYTAT